jgi:glycosyltransferase involved in cell wall biosynthesis
MVNLALGLKELGQDVSVACYHPEADFFSQYLTSSSIPIYPLEKSRRFVLSTPLAIARLSRALGSDLIISFLKAPSLYSEIAKFFWPKPKLIVSERNNYQDESNRFSRSMFRLGHLVANAVTANSFTQAEWLRSFPWLKRKTHTIYNGYDVPNWSTPPALRIDDLRLLGIGRISPQKNLLNLVDGLAILSRKHGIRPKLLWAGRRESAGKDAEYAATVEARLRCIPEIAENFVWLGETRNINQLLSESHALVLPSLYEGFPNVLCEALFAGRPVLASNVCDHPRLIKDASTGFLFDPTSPEAIANSIAKFCQVTHEQQLQMSTRCREVAIANFSKCEYAQAYLELAKRLLSY